MKHTIVKIAGLLSVAIPSIAMAQGSSGMGGGGGIIEIDSTPYLMDLVTKSVGETKEGADVIAENPYLKRVLQKISEVDWYFALALEQEIRDLRFCFTGPLYRISPHDPKHPHSIVKGPEEPNQRQGGYRLNDKAYIDRRYYENLDQMNRAFLIIHETAHSYFPMHLTDRNFRLRSFVKFLRKIDQGVSVVTRKHYFLQLSDLEVNFPAVVGELDDDRSSIEFLLSNEDEQLKIFKKSRNRSALIDVSDQTLARLNFKTRKIIDAAGGKTGVFEQVLQRALMTATQSEFLTYLNESVKEIEPIASAIAVAHQLSKEKVKWLIGSSAFKAYALNSSRNGDWLELRRLILNEMVSADLTGFAALLNDAGYSTLQLSTGAIEILEKLTDEKRAYLFQNQAFKDALKFEMPGNTAVDVSVVDYRLTASPELQLLVGSLGDSAAVVADLQPADDLPRSYRWMVSLIAEFARNQLFDVLQNEVFNQPAFYRALGLKNLKNQVRVMPIGIERERRLALSALDEISKKNIQYFMNRLQKALPASDYQAVAKLIQFNQF